MIEEIVIKVTFQTASAFLFPFITTPCDIYLIISKILYNYFSHYANKYPKKSKKYEKNIFPLFVLIFLMQKIIFKNDKNSLS